MKTCKKMPLSNSFTLADIPAHSTIVIGLSGGPDSVYLLHQLIELREEERFTLIAAHLDHEWRNSSIADAVFCKDLCKQLNVTLVSAQASELDHGATYQGSQEELGRTIRRFFFKQVMAEHKADYLALAHHQDDQIETFFINLIRGSTITGLCGMKAIDTKALPPFTLIRPLLAIDKQSILDYLTTHNLTYAIDPTNESDAYLRNRIRSQVLPAFYACDSRSKEQTMRTIGSLQKTEQFLQTITAQSLEKVTIAAIDPANQDTAHTPHATNDILEHSANQDSAHTPDTTNIISKSRSTDNTLTKLNLKLFFELDSFLQKRVIKAWLATQLPSHRSSQAFFNEIIRFLDSPHGGTHQLSPEWKLAKKQGFAFIQK